ncbi:MAG: nucleoside phosphorylase [Chloroflexota bacterium]|nr:nucleoside phosphorylase [Chloroflexota bacterium]MDE2898895.1 nucleoside phosphorylase [Chloroflexota bacterium]
MAGSPSGWLNHYGDSTPVIDPESHMRELAGRGDGDALARCPALVMGGFIDPMVAPIAEATGAVDSNLKPNLRIGQLDGHRVGVANVPVGASHASTLLEELIGLGARTLLIAGATGALRPGIDVGDHVIATNALREEGTSYHYQPPEHPARADGPAARALIEAAGFSEHASHAGRVWSTDAPYREFTGKVQRYGKDGVIGVDMEASALMIVSEFRGADLGLILTVSDLVYRGDWPNIFGTDEYRANCADMASIVVRAARALLAGKDTTDG